MTVFEIIDTMPFPEEMVPAGGQLSKDVLEYYVSIKIGSSKNRLYVIKRETVDDDFKIEDTVSLRAVVNTGEVDDRFPTITVDKKTLIFSRASDDYFSNDLYLAYRLDYTQLSNSILIQRLDNRNSHLINLYK